MMWNLLIKHFTCLRNANIMKQPIAALSKGRYTLSVKLSDFTM